MSHLSTEKLAGLAGVSKRQIQRMAAAGDVPGAHRTDGHHWSIPHTPALRKWSRSMRKLQTDRRRSKLPLRRKAAYARLEGSIMAAIRLIENAPDDDQREFWRHGVAATGARLIDLASGAEERTHRGGAWKEVEGAVETLHRWWVLHGMSATANERQRFAAVLGELAGLARKID